jgi:serine/threonine-protein kinase
VLALAALAAGGWWGYGRLNPPPDPPTVAAGPGLPDARPPEKVVTDRERDLAAKRDSRSIPPAEWFEASLELGLLYVRERRLAEADRVFEDLENSRQGRPGGKAVFDPAEVAGRLGRAVVLAYQDEPRKSNDLFEKAVAGPPKRSAFDRDKFLLAHPDLCQAVADALNRNAENLGLTRLPPTLEWLRTPAGLTRGPK